MRGFVEMPFCQNQVLWLLDNSYMSVGYFEGFERYNKSSSNLSAEHFANHFTILQNVILWYFIIKQNYQVFWPITYYYTQTSLSISLLLSTLIF